jgi:hypothetical protein
VLFCGPTGTGKTVGILRDIEIDYPVENNSKLTTSFSA